MDSRCRRSTDNRKSVGYRIGQVVLLLSGFITIVCGSYLAVYYLAVGIEKLIGG